VKAPSAATTSPRGTGAAGGASQSVDPAPARPPYRPCAAGLPQARNMGAAASLRPRGGAPAAGAAPRAAGGAAGASSSPGLSGWRDPKRGGPARDPSGPRSGPPPHARSGGGPVPSAARPAGRRGPSPSTVPDTGTPRCASHSSAALGLRARPDVRRPRHAATRRAAPRGRRLRVRPPARGGEAVQPDGPGRRAVAAPAGGRRVAPRGGSSWTQAAGRLSSPPPAEKPAHPRRPRPRPPHGARTPRRSPWHGPGARRGGVGRPSAAPQRQ